jgi:hypothetical protein
MIDARPASDREDPRKQWLARTVGMAHAMNPQPGILDEILSLVPIGALISEKAQKCGADTLDECPGGRLVGLLVTLHQSFDDVRAGFWHTSSGRL